MASTDTNSLSTISAISLSPLRFVTQPAGAKRHLLAICRTQSHQTASLGYLPHTVAPNGITWLSAAHSRTKRHPLAICRTQSHQTASLGYLPHTVAPNSANKSGNGE